jgi:hypothetical protein
MALLVSACRFTGETKATTPVPVSSLTAARNPFGLMIGLDPSSQRVPFAREMGVSYFRPWDVTVEDWNGSCSDRACTAAQSAGLGLILTVRNNGRGGPPAMSTTPAKDLAAYQRIIGEILDTIHPTVLVVENEETSTVFWTGTPEEYEAELRAACEQAHQRNIPCANGGMVSEAVGIATWAHYMDAGQTEQACDFARRALIHGEAEEFCGYRSLEELPERTAQVLDKVRQYLEIYARSGADYVNFHWYSGDASALAEAVTYLEEVTGLPAICNEFGLREQNYAATQAVMKTFVDLHIPYAIYFSLDRQAVALTDSDGTLRPNGEAFRDFMQANFK